MACIKFLVHLILLFTIPCTAFSLEPYYNLLDTRYEPLDLSKDLSYDQIIELIKKLEDVTLEESGNQATLEQINNYFIHLAEQGALPNQENGRVLQNDCHFLLAGNYPIGDSAHSFGRYAYAFLGFNRSSFSNGWK